MVMFNNLYFDLTRKVDSKLRLNLPSDVGDITGAKVAIVKPDDAFYQLYLLEQINSLVLELNERLKTATGDIRKAIIEDLDALYGCVSRVSDIDCQRRIALPPEFDAYVGKDIHLIGRYDNIRIYPQDVDYEGYITRARRNNLFK